MMTNVSMIEWALDVGDEGGYCTDTEDDGIIEDVGGDSSWDVNGVAGDDGSSGDAKLDGGLCVGDEVDDADTDGSDDNSDMTKMETSK